eukprot:1834151-Karenia_brevis.AAC.1
MKVSAADEKGGMTWLEIFILSLAASNQHLCITHGATAAAHKPLHLHSSFTKMQKQSHQNGTLQIQTHKFRGLG